MTLRRKSEIKALARNGKKLFSPTRRFLPQIGLKTVIAGAVFAILKPFCVKHL